MHDSPDDHWHLPIRHLRRAVSALSTEATARSRRFLDTARAVLVPPPEARSEEELLNDQSIDLQHRLWDARDNEESRLPARVSVSVPFLWVSEVYLPSHMAALMNAFERLEWAYDSGFASVDLSGWLRKRRHRIGWAAYSIPVVSERATGLDASLRRSAPLPDGVESATVHVVLPAPSVTVVTIQFRLTPEAANSIAEPLVRDYATELEPLPSGGVFRSPYDLRQKGTAKVRDNLHDRCRDFVTRHLPGMFAELDPKALPGADFILVTGASPREERVGFTWANAAGLPNDFNSYQTERISDLILGFDDDGSEVGRFLLAASDVGLSKYFTSWGIEPPSPEMLAYNAASDLDDFLRPAWTLWATASVVGSLTKYVGGLRDELGELAAGGHQVPTDWLAEFERDVSALATDIDPLTAELGSQFHSHELVAGHLAKFTPVDQTLGSESLFHSIHLDLGRRADFLHRTYSDLRQTVRSFASLATTQAMSAATAANLRLQRIAIILGVISLLGTISAVIVALLPYLKRPG